MQRNGIRLQGVKYGTEFSGVFITRRLLLKDEGFVAFLYWIYFLSMFKMMNKIS